MVEITATYEGELRCSAVHGPSGNQIHTDAPTDNNGKGEAFSPTDLVATALGTCIMTILGIVANRREIDLGKVTARLEKHMVSEPVRRIGKLVVHVDIPAAVSEDDRTRLERAAGKCPVHKSLHPDIEFDIVYNWA